MIRLLAELELSLKRSEVGEVVEDDSGILRLRFWTPSSWDRMLGSREVGLPPVIRADKIGEELIKEALILNEAPFPDSFGQR